MQIGVGLSLTMRGQGSAIDAEAAAWAAAVTAAGGTYSANDLATVNTKITAMKAASLWTKIAVWGPLLGDQLTAALVQYKSGAWAPATNVNFVAGDYTPTTGLTGNGTTKYLDTGFIATTLTVNDTHLSVYNRASLAAGGGIHIGTSAPLLYAPFTDGVAYSDQYNNGTGRVSGAITGPYGHVVATRTAAAAHTIYKNGVSVATNATSGGAIGPTSIFVFAQNVAGTPGSLTSHPLAAYSIGAGLSAGDVTAYNTIEQAYQTAIGRNV